MIQFLARFLQKVNKTSSCWLWTASCNSQGYGHFKIGKKLIAAHRFSWLVANNKKSTPYDICHKCDTPKCVNPTHLFIGTHTDNMKDMAAKGRRASFAGIRNGRCKLSNKQVLEIKSIYRPGKAKSLARKYKVVTATIYRIVNGIRKI